MTLSAPNRAAIVVFFAFLVLVLSSQVMRGHGIVPESMTILGFWALMGFIALLLALLAKVVTALVLLLAGVNK